MFRTLTGRLLLSYLGLTLALNILVFHVLDVATQGTLDLGMETILYQLVEDPAHLEEARTALSHGPFEGETFYLRLFDPHGKLVRSRGPVLTRADDLARSLGPEASRADSLMEAKGTPWRVVSRRLPDGAVLQLGAQLDRDAGLFESFAFHWRFGVVSLTLLAAGLAWWVAHRAMAGVKEVTRTAQEILEGSLQARVPEGQHVVEVNELTATINRMLDKIDALITDLKIVTADVAHDLRSPLTRIRSAAELALRGDDSLDAYQALAIRAIEETTRLDAVIATLLEIVRMDAGVEQLQKQSMDPDALLREVVDLYAESAEAKLISLHLADVSAAADGPRVDLERTLFQRALANVLDNAIKFTPPGGSIELGTRRQGDAVVLFAEDSGPGIPAADLPRVCERFYRADRSRNEPGHGLGLSYVESVVTAHGGSVRITSPDSGGTRVEIHLPI